MNHHFRLISQSALLLLMAGVFFYLLLSNMGLYPTVFADEYIYSRLSRLLPLSESDIPGYVYLKLYSYTNHCGDEFLGCVRVLNAVLFVLAAPFIYQTARYVAGHWVSVLVTLLALAGPINTYTAYFMPESFYFFSFWVLCWLLLGLDAGVSHRRWLLVGSVYGITTLVKPHSLFFLPALLLYLAYLFYRSGALWSRRSLGAGALFVIGAFAIKWGLGFLLAGSAGITIFGPLYSSVAASGTGDVSRYWALLAVALDNAQGHLMGLALVYGLPLAVAVMAAVRCLRRAGQSASPAQARFEKLALLTLAIVLNLIAVVALFTASVADAGQYENPYRLHLRYYNFALPLFYIVAAAAVSIDQQTLSGRTMMRYVVGGLTALVAVYALYTGLVPYTPAYVDSPELRGLQANLHVYRWVGGLLLVTLLVWMLWQKLGVRLYLYLMLPVFVFVAHSYVSTEQRYRQNADVYDRAGDFTKQYLPYQDRARLAVVGSDVAALYRALFHIDHPAAVYRELPQHAELDAALLPADTEWLLTIGSYAIPERAAIFQVQLGDFSLMRLAGPITLDFTRASWGGVIEQSSGLSFAESWGTWSLGNRVEFEFVAPLPERFELHLTAHAFGPNAGEGFIATVDKTDRAFTLSDSTTSQIIEFNNPGQARSLILTIPQPTSPEELGLGGDGRKLGMALVELKVVPVEE